MTTYARIKNGTVRELTTLDPAKYYVATKDQWVECPDDTLHGAEYDPSKKTFTLDLPEPAAFVSRLLEDEKAADALCEKRGIPKPYRPPNDTDSLVPPADWKDPGMEEIERLPSEKS